MITIGICDDEAGMLEELAEKINYFFLREQVKIKVVLFSGGRELLLYNKHLDVIFLDIQMDGPDGMVTARSLRNQGYKGFLIFVTVLEELVFDAFSVEAYDYLVKPLGDSRFELVMKRLKKSLRHMEESNLLIQKGHESIIIPFDDIIYCEVINRKIYLHITGCKTIDYYDRLEKLEQKLDNRFFKCHRSYLINLKYVRSLKNGQACLTTNDIIPVSRLRAEELSRALLQYMKEWRYGK